MQTPLADPAPSSAVVRQSKPVIDYASLRKSADCDRYLTASTPEPYLHQTPVRSTSPVPTSGPADVNPVDILKPFFQFMAHQQQKQLQQQHDSRSTSPSMVTSRSLDTVLMKTADEDRTRQAEKMSQLAAAIQLQQQQVTSTTTTGISFISNGLQMQFFNQQSSTTTVIPPVQAPMVSESPTRSNRHSSLSNQPSENDLSIEVRSLAMKYLEDDQLAVAIENDRQSPTPPSTVRQSPQVFDKSMSFATQKYFEKYGIISGSTRQQQYYLSPDDNDVLLSSSPPAPQQRMLLPLPASSTATTPIFAQPSAPYATQARILDLSQIRKLPKLL